MATLQIKFVSESAGYENVLGWYNSRTGEAGIIFINTNDDGPNAGISAGTTASIQVDQADIDAGYIGFFVIPNGADLYGTGDDSVLNGPLTFDTKPNGDGIIRDADGKKLRGEQGEIVFTDPELNKHDTDYTSARPGRQKDRDLDSDDADGITGRIAFEDLVRHSDRDYNDLVIDVQLVPENRPPEVQDAVFQVAENTAAGTIVGKVVATDQDAGQLLTYAIESGNENGAFAINAATGEITVADASKLDFENPALDGYSLAVKVTDNGSGALSDTATVNIAVANVVEMLLGHAVDGYVSGATVFADADGDGALDAGEKNATTDASGNFTLVDGSGPLVMTGGVDLSTGLAFTGVLRAPEGSTVVTPLTTLIAALVDGGQSVAQASANVASAFGLGGLTVDGLPIDLLNFDPIPDAAAGNADGDEAAIVLGAGIQVRNTIVHIGALLAGAGATDAQTAATAALAALVSSGAEANLDDPATVQALINSAADLAAGVSPADIAAVVADAAQVLAASNDAVNDALAGGSGVGVLQALAQVATVAQGAALTGDLAQAGAANNPGTLANDYTGDNLEAKIDNAPVGDVDGGSAGTPGDDILTGGPGNDLIDGLAGNDQLYGLAGNDQLDGGDGNDVLVGDIGNDTLRGGAGNDVLDGGVLADLQSDMGVRDTDRADYSAAAGPVNVNLATGVAQDGDGGTDTLIGVEAVNGSAYDDVLTGGSEAFVEFFRGGAGDDTIDGGNWNDRAEYMNATGGIVVNMAALASNRGTVTGNASVGSDTLANVEIVYGTDFADTYNAVGFLSASQPGGLFSSFNSFEGRAGNDTIVGSGATRIEFTAATGGIVANFATGTATGDESVGTDTFSGVNAIRATQYADTLIGGNPLLNGFESYEGRAGDDDISGGLGFDLAIYAFDGAITTGITVNLADGIVAGDPLLTGTDTLSGIEGVRGSHMNDSYNATGFSSSSANSGALGPNGTYNEFEGMAGNDTITGNGNTRIIYTAAREGVTANLASGTVVGGPSVGTDTILGGVWAVRGSNFDDLLSGSDSAAAEYFEGRAGDDFIDGQDGFDVAAFDFGASGGGTFIATGPISFTATAPGLGTDLLFNIEQITGTSFGDLFDGSASLLNHTFLGLGGNDTLIGSQGSDFLSGGDGNDVLASGAGNDFMDGGFGIDRADYSIAFGPVNVDLMAMTASDGMGGNDTLNGVEDVTGSAFDDALFGDAANNALFGGMGNDVLRGREGADYIDGGLGLDRIEFFNPWDGMDTIAGFEAVPGGDVIDIENLLLNWTGYAGGAGGPLANFVRLETVGPDAQLQIDVDGLGPMFWQPLATLLGRAGHTLDMLVANGNLDTGVVSGVTLFGTPGNDFLIAGPGNDTILADLGNDFLQGGAGNDLLNGGFIVDLQSDLGWRDFDRADYSTAPNSVDVNLATGIAFDGAGGMDTLIGIEQVNGSSFDDVLTGSSVTFSENFHGRAGNDTINGGGGFDRAEYAIATGGVTITLGALAGPATGSATVSGDPSVGFDTLLDVEQFNGSDHADTYFVGEFVSNSLPGGFLATFNAFEGRGGNDGITGNGATRIEYASAGSGVNVNLATGIATSVLAGGHASVGTDSFSGVSEVRGSSFADVLTGGNLANESLESFAGRGGDDFIDGGTGWDRADYAFDGAVSVGINVNLAGGIVTGDIGIVGTDTLRSVEAIRGTHQADTYDATGFNFFSANSGSSGELNEFQGMAGNDTIFGNGSTRVSFFSARESVSVDLQAGIATGGASVGVDSLSGVNAARGSNFDDTLVGSGSSDTLEGLIGNDLLRGGAGNDFIDGGPGSDRIDFDSPWEGVDSVAGFDAVLGGDVLDIADLLQNWTGYAGGAGGPLATYVRIVDLGPDAQVQVDPDGIGPMFWQSLATLLGRAGLTLDMLTANGNLDAGAVSGVTLTGTPGNDFLDGTPGNDTILADLGNDFLRGRAGNDLLNGGVVADLQSDVGWRDSDRADYSSAFMGVDVNLATGIAQDGEGGTDTLIGIESVTGSLYNDLLTGSGAFFESFQANAGDDTIHGAGGFDRADYVNASAGVAINLGGFGGFSSSTGTVSGDASVGTDTLLDVEQFIGSNSADIFTVGLFSSGSLPGGFFSSFNVFEGRGGNDEIYGNGNTRIEYAGATGAVDVNLATGVATGDASVGTDTFTGVNQVRGSAFADKLTGGNTLYNSLESLDGRGGNDEIDGGDGWDRAEYAFNGAVTMGITVNLADGTVTGDPTFTGSDTLRGIESVRGSHQNDWYNATDFSGSSTNAGWSGTLNEFEGMAGNDTIIGNGSTRISYTLAREGVSVDLAAGMAVGGTSVGSDNFSGVNAVRGSNFDDVLAGSASNDTLEGLNGNDLLRGGQGADYIEGGPGSDRIDFNSTVDGLDTVSGFEAFPGGDVLDIEDLLATTGYGGGAGGPLSNFVRLETLGPDVQLQVSVGPVWTPIATLLGQAGLTLDALLANGNLDTGVLSGITLVGTPGNDSLIGTPGNDTLIGLLGNDFLRGGGGNDLLDGGIIADLQSDVGARDSDRVDYSTAMSGVNVNLVTGVAFDGEGGTDTLIGIEGVGGSPFDDVFTGSSTFAESYLGGAGNDTIYGGGGFDSAQYFNASSGVSISVGGFGGSSSSASTVTGDASVGTDSLFDVEQFGGSNLADTFTVGNFLSASQPGGFVSNFNSLEGRGGNDIISGNGATRIEYSVASGAVNVNFATGIAAGDGSVGTDSFTGVNAVRGSAFADTLVGGNPLTDGFESFDGRGGNDTIDGSSGWDRADYAFFSGPITTGITVELATGTVTGDPVLAGTDTLLSIEAIRGSHLADNYDATGFSGSSTNGGSSGTLNEFEGMAGNDTIVGNGTTRVSYASAREGVSVDLETGTATGGASVGTDSFSGVNAVRGSNFDDVLLGGNGNDILEGGLGNDLLRGSQGADTIDGGPGSDRLDYDSLVDGTDAILNFDAAPGGDVIDIADLLQNWTSHAGGAGGLLSEFVKLQDAGGDAQLQIDANGSTGGENWETLATLLGDAGLDLDTLLAQGNLDTVI